MSVKRILEIPRADVCDTTQVMGNFVLILLCMAAGALARRFRLFPADAAATLNRFIILVSLPAVTLLHVQPMRLTRAAALPIAAPWLVIAGGALFYSALARARGWDRPTLGTLLLVAGLGNTSFLGFPLIEALYGPRALEVAVLADQGGSFLALSTVGIAIACAFSGRPVSARDLFGRVLRFPPFIALLAALALRPFPMPELAATVLDKLGATLAPLALFSVGLQLAASRRGLRAERGPLLAGLAWKMALAPLGVALLFAAIPAAREQGEIARISVVQAAMAPMITAGILASEHGLNARLANLLLGIGIPLSLATVPLASWALRGFF